MPPTACPIRKAASGFIETLEILKKAWTEPTFSYDGKYPQLQRGARGAAALSAAAPPIRIAGASEDTFPTLGTARLSAVRLGAQRLAVGLAPDLKAYRDAYEAAGHPGKRGGSICACRCMSARPSKQAREEGEPSIMAGYKSLIDRLEGSPNARRRAELEEVRTHHLRAGAARQGHRRRGRSGSPTGCKELEDELGIDGILFELNFGARDPGRSDDALAAADLRGYAGAVGVTNAAG